jgi:hypothetical protein
MFGVQVRGKQARLSWLLDLNRCERYRPSGLRLCGPRQRVKQPNKAHAPERTHLHHRAWPRRDGRPRHDCRPRTGRPGGTGLAVLAGLEGDDTSLRAQPLRPQSTKQGRVPGAVPPNPARGWDYACKTGGWVKQRLGRPSSHCEPSLRLQQHKAASGQALRSCEQPPNRSGSLPPRSDLITSGPRYIRIMEVFGKNLHPHAPA